MGSPVGIAAEASVKKVDKRNVTFLMQFEKQRTPPLCAAMPVYVFSSSVKVFLITNRANVFCEFLECYTQHLLKVFPSG